MKLARRAIVSAALAPLLTLSGAFLGQPREAPPELAVISEGTDTDLSLAARNAAYNALTKVVGAFIDANKAVERKTQKKIRVRLRN